MEVWTFAFTSRLDKNLTTNSGETFGKHTCLILLGFSETKI